MMTRTVRFGVVLALFSAASFGCSSSGSSGGAQAGASGSSAAGAPSGGNANTGGTSSGGTSSGGSSGTGASSSGGSHTGGTGGSSGAGTGGHAGQSSYNPCPTNGSPCRIMPLGDSITDGVGSSDGASYRHPLFHLALQAKQNITFVGSHESGPNLVDNVPFPKHQEGHSGWTIDDGGGRSGLYPQIQTWLTNTPPDIVTLMIGTNDVDISLDLPNAPTRLGLLLDRIAQYAPTALTVLAQIVPSTDDGLNQRVRDYNAAMPALVKTRADAGKHIVLVDMYGAFTANTNYKTAYMTDRLHPNDAGYAVMATTWYASIGDLLPAQ